MTKIKNINEGFSINERSSLSRKGLGDTRISIYKRIENDTYKHLHTGSNKIVVAGSAFLAAKITNVAPRIFTRSYNDELQLDNNNPITDNNGVPKDEQVMLFGVGDTGCGPESRQVFKVDYKSHIPGDKLIPFIVRTREDGDINNELKENYFGKKTEANGSIKYYFKAFTVPPEVHQEFLDGTPIDENIYLNQRKDEVQSYMRLQMDISPDDFVKFWDMNNIDERRISSITLLTAIKSTVTDNNGVNQTVYQNIRPLTVYHFPKEDMIESKGVKIVYDIYL